MSEGMEQFGSTPAPARSLETAASEFRSKVEDAANRLNSAAEQFVTMSESLLSAVDEARQAADRATAAQRSMEELNQRMTRDYGNVNGLVRDLQQRIAALATLAQPLPAESEAQPTPEAQPMNSGHSNPGESSW